MRDEDVADMDVDTLWDALRSVACSTKPHTDAKCIVMLKREDVVRALALISDDDDKPLHCPGCDGDHL